jgi:hypothetical protein
MKTGYKNGQPFQAGPKPKISRKRLHFTPMFTAIRSLCFMAVGNSGAIADSSLLFLNVYFVEMQGDEVSVASPKNASTACFLTSVYRYRHITNTSEKESVYIICEHFDFFQQDLPVW